jgi:uncharacterized peroxidase-related enzyme
MNNLPISDLPIISEEDAVDEVGELYDEIKRMLESPFVPNICKVSAGSPTVLAGTWAVFRHVHLESSLPLSLKAMVLYSIASANRCTYCSAVHQVTCRTLGVDEDTLVALNRNLSALSPQRVQTIIKFAVKCATDGQQLTKADYDQVREEGINDEELMEIIALAALGNYLDTLTDAMKLEIDSVYAQALGG